MRKRNIVYVNFAPYQNTGRIFDYILSNFKQVIVFTFNFNKLSEKQTPSELFIYNEGKLVLRKSLFQLPISQSLLFTLLPVRSLLISAQVVYHLLRLRKQYKPLGIFFTVNAFTAFVGNILRNFGVVSKTIVWVWDYYPPMHQNKIIMLMRWIYWQFDKQITKSDSVVFLNERLQDLRKNIGILPKSKSYPIVPIGTVPQKARLKEKNTILGFVGVVKKSQGLDLVFDSLKKKSLTEKFSLIVVGGGPDLSHIKKRASNSNVSVIYSGYVDDEDKIIEILKDCTIGIAPYVPEESNVSYYGDPSKIKLYLSVGLPVITTDVFVFAKEIKKYKAGVIIDYFDPSSLQKAIEVINNNYSIYSQNAIKLARKYQYQKIYKTLFDV